MRVDGGSSTASEAGRAARWWLRAALTGGVIATSVLGAAPARAQLEPLREGIEVGAWTFFPSIALRLRGEYRRNPVDLGGDRYQRTAVMADGYQRAAPTVLERVPALTDQWLLAERSRLGLAVRSGVVSAAITLQDARVAGVVPGAPDAAAAGGFGALAPHEAFIDVRSNIDDPWMRVRLGRQRVAWGEGNLLGDSEWAARGGAIDAGRVLWYAGDVEIELLAAMLAPPGPVSAPLSPAATPTGSEQPGGEPGTGAQLYGLRGQWAIAELFAVELAALARIAREPLPAELSPSDTYVLDGRLFGERRGVSYSAEGAYQLGRVAGYGVNRSVSSFAAAGRVRWRTALPGELTFAARGAYASGDDSGGQGDTFHRFDPIAPDVHGGLGQMDLFGWSNAIGGGGEISAHPLADLEAAAGYALAALAQPGDRWSTGALVAVGANPSGTERLLGHEVDVRLSYAPFDELRLLGGYSVLILGAGGEGVLQAAGRGGTAPLHYGLLQAELSAP